MGYDMYIENGPDDAERAAVKDANERLKQARATGVGIVEAYQARDAVTRSYFRLSVWGMGTARELMGAFGMLTFEDQPIWPETGEYVRARDAFDKTPDDENTRQALEAARSRVQAARDAVRAADPGGPGIAHYKLCSNDAWLVTPREIAAALKTYASAEAQDRAEAARACDQWESWIQFLSNARDRGGFRVC
ncbi:hypothetical protein [Streptomyces sp. NPDC004050]